MFETKRLIVAAVLAAVSLAPSAAHAQSDCPFWSTCGSLQQRVDDLERRARQQDFERMFPAQTYTPPAITIAPPTTYTPPAITIAPPTSYGSDPYGSSSSTGSLRFGPDGGLR